MFAHSIQHHMFFAEFSKNNAVFPTFFQGFGPPEGTPRRRWDRPRATLVPPSDPGAPEPLKMDPGRSILSGFGPRVHPNESILNKKLNLKIEKKKK